MLKPVGRLAGKAGKERRTAEERREEGDIKVLPVTFVRVAVSRHA
jgi:hypothetical protein